MINLLPPEYHEPEQLEWSALKDWLVAVSLISVVLLVAIGALYLETEINRLESRNEIVKNELNKVNNRLSTVNKIEAAQSQLKQDLNHRQELQAQGFKLDQILIRLETTLPEDSWLQNFNINEDRSFSLAGFATEQVVINDLLDNLKSNGKFTNIVLHRTEKREVDFEDYDLDLAINYQISGQIAE